MLIEDAADSEAVAVQLVAIYAAIRKLGRIIKAITCQFYLCRHVAIRVCWESLHAKIALVGHEDRLEGEGR